MTQTASAGPGSVFVRFLIHLRIPFQLMLAPFVLVGALLSGARPSPSWLVAFVAIHVGLYGGMTAYNSYYDRDEGPVGFLKRPVPAPIGVRDLALSIQVLAIAVLCVLAGPAGGVALVIALLGIGYSHPRTRWKASTVTGLAAVAVGQGAGGVYLGWFAMGGSGAPGPGVHLVAAGAGTIALGLYPVTQVYQIDEDRARGDVTLPVRVGWRRALAFSLGVSSLGLWGIALALRSVLPPSGLALIAAGPFVLAAVIALWSRRFESQSPERNHDWAMGIGAGASALFWIVLITGIVR